MRARDELRSRDRMSHALLQMNDEMTEQETNIGNIYKDTVENYQGNRRKIITQDRERSNHIWRLFSIFPKAEFQLLQQTVYHINVGQTHLFPSDTTSRWLTRTLNHFCTDTTDELYYIPTGFNQRKLPHRTISVAVEVTTASIPLTKTYWYQRFHDKRFLKRHVDDCRWLSDYICRCVKSKARMVHTGVPQGSKLSLPLFSLYLANMPRPTAPAKRLL